MLTILLATIIIHKSNLLLFQILIYDLIVRLHDQFVVDVIQGGAGTSTNMNANEVIANRALEILGHGKGEYDKLHPNEHVNMGQSTNDVYPTALRLATYWGVLRLQRTMFVLREAFAANSVDIESAIWGINSTNLVSGPATVMPELVTLPEVKYLFAR